MRTLKGLGALIVLIGLLVGVPMALALVAGNPIPTAGEFSQALTGVDYGGRFMMGTILPVIGWLAWASFAIGVAVEIPMAIRRIGTPRLRTPHIVGLGAQQALAGSLIAAILALAPAAPAFAGAPTMAGDVPQTRITQQAQPQALAPVVAERPEQTSERSTTVEHTVVSGDTLSEISEEYLGDANQWPELAEATRGAVQPNGRALEDPDLIHPGWTVTVPGAPTKNSPDSQDPTHLSAGQQAGEEREQAQPAPEAAETQENGNQDSAPKAAEQPAPEAANDQPAAPGATFTAPGEAANAGGHATSHQNPEVDEADAAAESIDWRTTGGIGAFLAAGVLAVLGLRRTQQRRRRKPGHVIPMPEPEAAETEAQLKAVADTEGADELDLVLKALGDWARQTSTALPEMFCLRVTADQIALYLATPSQLPEPFRPEADDGTVWTIEPGQIDAIGTSASAPYPALVTIGQDATGAQLLLDLEYLGTLGVDGPSELIPEVLDAMAVELATSTWGEELQVTLVGVADGLAAATGTGRVRQINDLDELMVMLRGRARSTKRALEDLGVDNIHEAKASGQDESWMPEIVILGVDPTDEQVAEIRELTEAIPRLGIAAVTAGNSLSSQWQLNIHDAETADLDPIGLQLSPQKITPEESTRIISVLTTSLQDPAATENIPTAEELDLDHVLGNTHPHLAAVPEGTEDENDGAMDARETELEEQVEEADQERYVPADNHQAAASGPSSVESANPATPSEAQDVPDAEAARAAGTTEVPEDGLRTVEQQGDIPIVDEQSASEIEAVVPEADTPVSATRGMPTQAVSEEETLDIEAQELLDASTPQAPVIRLFGEVKVIGAAGQAPTSASSGTVSHTQTARCTALAAFLALNPGASAEQYHAAFWPNASAEGAKASSNRNKLSNLTRKYLGQDSDGVPYFPPVTTEGYRIDERIITDWQVIQDLIGHDPTTANTVRLVAAMRLVHGAPFKDVKGRNYAWAEELHQNMIETICDAAHELVTRSLNAGHHNHAQLAAKVGRTVDPANESMWRDALLSEAAAGNREEVSRLVENLYEYLEGFEDGTEPEEETNELIDQLRGRGYRIAS